MIISLDIEDQLLRDLLLEADASDIGIEAHIKNVFRAHLLGGAANEHAKILNSDLGDLLALAVKRASSKSSGDQFTLQDLFSEQEWSRVPAPRAFGRMFRQAVEEDGAAKHVTKTATNKAIYQRT